MSEVFADVPSEGATLDIDKAFERLEAKGETSSPESQPEKKETEKPSQGGKNTQAQENIPFHKHPRWQKMQTEFQKTKEELERIKAEKGENKPITVPDWWKKQYGDTPESKTRYEAVVQKDGELDWIKQQIKEDLKAETQAEQQTVKAGEEYVNTQLQELTDEGLKFEKNALLKFMVDFQNEFGPGALLDSAGNYDFRKSLTLKEKMQPDVETPNIKKQVASMGGRGRAAAPQSSSIPVLSRNALRRGNWRDADLKN